MVTEAETENEAMDAHRKQMEARKRMEKVKTLPLMSTDDTDLKTGEQGLPRMNTDERGSEKKNSPLINTDETDLGAMEKMLPQRRRREYEGLTN